MATTEKTTLLDDEFVKGVAQVILYKGLTSNQRKKTCNICMTRN